MIPDLRSAAQRYLAENKSVFGHDRQKTVGASEIGLCSRRSAYEKRNTPHDEDYRPPEGAAFRGNIIEDEWTVPIVDKWVTEDLGGELLWAGQENQRSLVAEKWKLSATPDGLAVGVHKHSLAPYGVKELLGPAGKLCFVTEMKSVDPRKPTEEFPLPAHMVQLQTQLGLINHDKSHDWRPKWGAVIYVNASFLDDIRVFPDFYRQAEFYNLIRRARLVYSLPPEMHIPEGAIGGGKDCEQCPFAKRCKAHETALPPFTTNEQPWTADQSRKIRTLVGTIDNQKAKLKDAKTRKEAAEAELRMICRDGKTKNIKMKLNDGRPFTVRWLKKAGALRYDQGLMSQQLMEDGHDLEDFKTRGEPSESLTVKVEDPKNGLASNVPESKTTDRAKGKIT